MKIDWATSTIQPVAGDELRALYGFLGDCFPPDRPLFDELLRTGRPFYTWTPTALYAAGKIVGNVSLMPMRVWLAGQATTLVGVASVATAPECRRQGVARRLLEQLLQSVDKQALASVLFTGLPEVYRSLGYQAVAQRYVAAKVSRLALRDQGFQQQVCDTLDHRQCQQLAAIYAGQYPNYDGKVVRDDDYWWLYATLFRFAPHSRVLLCKHRGEVLGYARYEHESDRLTLSEFCAAPAAAEVAEALLAFVHEHALHLGVAWLSWALPPQHFAWALLQRANMALQPEPPGAARETFMVRLPPGSAEERLLDLQWSLADKF